MVAHMLHSALYAVADTHSDHVSNTMTLSESAFADLLPCRGILVL